MGSGGSRGNWGSVRDGGRFEFHQRGIRRTSFEKPRGGPCFAALLIGSLETIRVVL